GASLHATAALSGARSGSGAATRARGTRSATQPARAAERLPVSSALSLRDGCLQARGAAERHGRRRPHRGVLATCRPRRAAGKRKRSPGGGTREGGTKEVRKVELACGVWVRTAASHTVVANAPAGTLAVPGRASARSLSRNTATLQLTTPKYSAHCTIGGKPYLRTQPYAYLVAAVLAMTPANPNRTVPSMLSS